MFSLHESPLCIAHGIFLLSLIEGQLEGSSWKDTGAPAVGLGDSPWRATGTKSVGYIGGSSWRDTGAEPVGYMGARPGEGRGGHGGEGGICHFKF